MNNTLSRSYAYTLYALSLAGFLFSGYVSGTKFFTKACAFGETCPLFLGYPACYFGFMLFGIICAGSFIVLMKDSTLALKIVSWTSVVGIFFAGNFVVREIVEYIHSGFKWSALGFPTCAYGFIFFVLISLVGFKMRKISP